MDYVVLARKLRPMRFQDLIGQETVSRALCNAVQTARIAHAYLFTGSRGVGKTSTARILTKAVNCTNPHQGEPCNVCENCVEITNNASQDVFEIDAASNRGIDNIRELRETIKYTPTKCAYKTYIIDEVHMLTTESFNALLKTLEEPPSKVMFILATTAPHKIPETILSRCQRYDFPRIAINTMVDYLAQVTRDEGLQLGRAGLETIARNANGGMRDALTAVDQVVAFAGHAPDDAQVASVLGLMDQREVHTLLGNVLQNNLSATLQGFSEIVERGHDLHVVLGRLLEELKDLTLFRTLPEGSTYFQDHSPSAVEFYRTHGGNVSLDALQQRFYLFLELESQLKRSEFTTACFEMALVKACGVEPLVGLPELLSQVRALSESGITVPLPDRVAPAGTSESILRNESLDRVAPTTPAAPINTDQKFSEPRPQDPTMEVSMDTPRPREHHSAQSAGQEAAASDGEGDPLPVGHSIALPIGESSANPETPGGDLPGSEAITQGRDHAPTKAPSFPPLSAYDQTPVNTAGSASGQVQAAMPVSEALMGQEAPKVELPGSMIATQASTVLETPEEMRSEVALDSIPPPGSLPCEDERWRMFLDAVNPLRRKLAADLRRAEVSEIDSDVVCIVPAEGGGITPEDEALLVEPLRTVFGDAFILRVDRDRKEKARQTFSLVGREQQLEQARLALERRTAENDASVRKITQFFPEARVKHARPREGKRRNDV